MESFGLARKRALYKVEAINRAYTQAASGAPSGHVASADIFDHTSLLRPLDAFSDVAYNATTGNTFARWDDNNDSTVGAYYAVNREYSEAAGRVRDILNMAHDRMGTVPNGLRHAKTKNMLNTIDAFITTLDNDRFGNTEPIITLLARDADSFEKECRASDLAHFFGYDAMTGELVFKFHMDDVTPYTKNELALQSAVVALTEVKQRLRIQQGHRRAFEVIANALNANPTMPLQREITEYDLTMFTDSPAREDAMKEFLTHYWIEGFSFDFARGIRMGDEYDDGSYRIAVVPEWSPV